MTLLAKSARRGRPPPLLADHLYETEECAVRLFGDAGRWGSAWRRFFKLGQDERFLPTLRVAALAHDLGKANEDFQGAVTGKLQRRQSIRHEHLSALALVHPVIAEWLTVSATVDFDVVCGAVLSHHAKAADDADHEHGWGVPRGQTRVLFADGTLRPVLERIADIASLGPPPWLVDSKWPNGSWEAALDIGLQRARQFGRSIGRNDARRRLMLATKAALMVSDAAASGLVREGHDLAAWIGDILAVSDVTADEIDSEVIAPRLAQLRGFSWHPFQLAAERAPSRALLVAGCGSGKTLAAWAWAREQARTRRAGRVIFLYPTRGTATEGFRDYVSSAPEAKAALVHGTARYELDAILENPADGRDFTNEAEQRLFALQHWSRRFYSATVDQFLAFLEFGFASMCLLPVLADAIVIVDEVHSFDHRMFSDLVAFLHTFDVPVMCMTATLPAGRLQDLTEAGLKLVSAAESGLAITSETHLRYELERRANEDGLLELVLDRYRAGQRVLWVVNTVARCQALARMLQEQLPPGHVLVYHSRFTLEHRQDRHRATVDAFRKARDSRVQPAIAVTTQVCEMSLDLDADLLVTDLAPCEALVQRFGRANRHLSRGTEFRATLIVVEPPDERPYERPDLDAARAFLKRVPSGSFSQATLAELLAVSALDERRPNGDAFFLDAGWFALERPFRDSVDRSVPCILDDDATIDEVCERHRSGRPIDGYVVPVPRGLAREAPGALKLPSWLRLVDAARYDPLLGLRVAGGGDV